MFASRTLHNWPDYGLLQYMTIFAKSAAALIFSSTLTHAGVCGPDSDADIAVFEASKKAFLTTQYRDFIDIGGAYFSDLEENFEGYFGQLASVFPNGYDRCITILRRREEPGFYQDLILFFPKGFPGPITLHLVAAHDGKDIRLMYFNYNTAIGEVLDGLL